MKRMFGFLVCARAGTTHKSATEAVIRPHTMKFRFMIGVSSGLPWLICSLHFPAGGKISLADEVAGASRKLPASFTIDRSVSLGSTDRRHRFGVFEKHCGDP